MKRFRVTTLYDMAKIDKRDTHLPVSIWVDSSGGNRNTRHNLPRVKIQKDKNNDMSSGNLIPVVLNKGNIDIKGKTNLTTQELTQVKQFLQRNEHLILKHWVGEITDKELLNSVK